MKPTVFCFIYFVRVTSSIILGLLLGNYLELNVAISAIFVSPFNIIPRLSMGENRGKKVGYLRRMQRRIDNYLSLKYDNLV